MGLKDRTNDQFSDPNRNKIDRSAALSSFEAFHWLMNSWRREMEALCCINDHHFISFHF